MALQDFRTLKQAATETELTVRQLQWMVRKGRLTAYQPGGKRGRLYVRADELETLMQPRETSGQNK